MIGSLASLRSAPSPTTPTVFDLSCKDRRKTWLPLLAATKDCPLELEAVLVYSRLYFLSRFNNPVEKSHSKIARYLGINWRTARFNWNLLVLNGLIVGDGNIQPPPQKWFRHRQTGKPASNPLLLPTEECPLSWREAVVLFALIRQPLLRRKSVSALGRVFGFSRVTIRDAIQRLTAGGLLDLKTLEPTTATRSDKFWSWWRDRPGKQAEPELTEADLQKMLVDEKHPRTRLRIRMMLARFSNHEMDQILGWTEAKDSVVAYDRALQAEKVFIEVNKVHTASQAKGEYIGQSCFRLMVKPLFWGQK